MKTFLISRRAALAGALLAPAAGVGQTQSTLAKIRAAGVIIIGNGGAFPPFEFIEDGQLAGFDRDLGEELARRLGVKAQWQVIEFAGLIGSLVSGRVDTLITAFTWTEERAQRISFSKAYFKTGIAAAFRPNVAVVDPADLAGKVVGVQTGSAGEKFTRDGYADKIKEIKNYPEFPLAMRDLEIGRLDVFVNTLPALRYSLAKTNKAGLKVTGAWDARDIGINTRPTDQDLMTEINAQIDAMRADGFLKRIDEKWFGAA